MGIFTIFNTGLNSLNAYSAALGVTANNISNANNEDYTRQTVSYSTLSPESYGGNEIGRGLYLSGVDQIINTFVEERILNGSMSFGQAEAKAEYLQSVESVFNELDGTGLNAAVGEFFDSWNAVASDPQSIPERESLLNSAQNMIDMFDQYSDALGELRTIVDEEIRALTPAINSLVSEIQELNLKIKDDPNDALHLKDARRAAVNDLAKFIDLNVIENPADGTIQIYTKAGNPLVNGDSKATFSYLPNGSNNNLLDLYVTVGGTTTNITNTVQDGRLKGLIDVRDTNLTDYLEGLDNFAYTIMSDVNGLHQAGFDLDGNTGNDFFTNLGAASGAAGSLSLNAGLTARGIGASSALAEVPGNNTQALAIANLALASDRDFDPGAGTNLNSYSGFFGEFLADIGSDTYLANQSEDFEYTILNQVKLERMEVSGVNIDEEEINIVKFQSAIQASTRLVQIADEILESLIRTL